MHSTLCYVGFWEACLIQKDLLERLPEGKRIGSEIWPISKNWLEDHGRQVFSAREWSIFLKRKVFRKWIFLMWRNREANQISLYNISHTMLSNFKILVAVATRKYQRVALIANTFQQQQGTKIQVKNLYTSRATYQKIRGFKIIWKKN